MDPEEDAQFFELEDKIPYKKVEWFKVSDVDVDGPDIIITLYKKCEDLPEDKNGYRIKRKLADFQWLLTKLRLQSQTTLALPTIATSTYWQQLKSMTYSFSNSQKLELRKQEERRFTSKNVRRFLELISEVSLASIYDLPYYKQSSLFTFLDEKYEMYKMQNYQKQNRTALESLGQTLNNGSKKLLGYLTVWKSEKKHFLKEQAEAFLELEEKIKKFKEQLNLVEESINQLSTNFLNQQKRFEEKQITYYQISLRIESLLKVIMQILMEINNAIANAKSASGKIPDQKINKQLESYGKFIKREFVQISKQFTEVIQQFFLQSAEKYVQISLIQIYPTM